jgi:hypothetical protein
VEVDAPPASSNVSLLQAALDWRKSTSSAISSEPSLRPGPGFDCSSPRSGRHSPSPPRSEGRCSPSFVELFVFTSGLGRFYKRPSALALRGKGKAPPPALPGGFCGPRLTPRVDVSRG